MGETCCCGCCTVATGTAIIAILDIIGGVLQMIQGSIVASLMISHPDRIPEEHYPNFKDHTAVYITFQFIGIFMALVYTIVSGLLFQGYRTRNVRLCLPWLYWNYISLGLAAIGVVIIFFALALNGQFVVGLILVLIAIVVLGIAVYFVLVVQRFVNELRGGGYSAANANIN
ncbi:uncharacterized protein LOC110847357 [Folsomia candida]|uniref:Lysosomal-associated transmembrane protein 4A n=1 Tax=Folsomia candida TaxID=158441 RepID=A0A226EMW7_FOLCA|nr:uncharacterized protein LOC110847357 [Folsomia candida]XP_035706443.1 uncharacterized protein LOC110847357 [Folsomia candida]OXA58809.1 hypothetical protein Fcan01_06646 [Folsomia candida]